MIGDRRGEGEIEVEISCTRLKLARYLILVEYSGKIAAKFVSN